jgi:hypothetical protein
MRYKFLSGLVALIFYGVNLPVCSQILDISKKICLNKTEANPREIIFELEKESGFRFAFQSDLIKSEELISINGCEYSISEIIQKVFASENLELILTGKQVIVIKPKPLVKQRIAITKPLTEKEIDDIENSLTKLGELAIDTLNRKYSELIAIDRITVSSISNGNASDSSIMLIENRLIKVDYDTNTFIVYDTIRTKFVRIVKLGLRKLASINWSSSEKSDRTIINRYSPSKFKFKRGVFHYKIKRIRSKSIFRKKNDHIEPYEESNYKHSFLNTNYFIGLETGASYPFNYEPNNFTIPNNYSPLITDKKASYFGGFKIILNEDHWETDIGIRYQQIQLNVWGYNYTLFTDSLNIIDRNVYYTYDLIPIDTYYKYYPGRDTVWVTVYDSVRVMNEILTYGNDSLKNNENSTLTYHHFEIPIGVRYNFNIYKNFKFKPQLSLIYSYDRTEILDNSTLEDWRIMIHSKEYSSLLVSLDLNFYYSINDRVAFFTKLYACNSVVSFSKERNWDYYSAFGAGIGLICKIRSEK